MDGFTESLVAFIVEENNLTGLAMLGLAAFLEHLVPPFPGDTLTLLGAVLITAYGWSFLAVFGSVLLGSSLGAMGGFYLGAYWRRYRDLHGRKRAALDSLVEKFARHGAAYLVLNRFLPGVRSLFFMAAGLAGIRPGAVFVYSLASAALWNLALISLGSALGANLDTLQVWVRQYTTAAGSIIAAVVAIWIIRAVYSHIRRQRQTRDAASADANGPAAGATPEQPETPTQAPPAESAQAQPAGATEARPGDHTEADTADSPPQR